MHLQLAAQAQLQHHTSGKCLKHTDGVQDNGDKRHLLRWWIAQPKERNPRPIAPSFAPRSLVPPEGGFRVPDGSNVRLPFFPYSRNDGEGISTY